MYRESCIDILFVKSSSLNFLVSPLKTPQRDGSFNCALSDQKKNTVSLMALDDAELAANSERE